MFLKAGGHEQGTSLFDRIKAFFGAEVTDNGPMAWTPAADRVKQSEQVGIETLHKDPDVRSTIEIIIYGLKGMAAYADHAQILGKTNAEVLAFNHQALAATCDPGFGHNAVLGVANKVIEAVKGGAIKHFFLIGGCDGAKSGRNYYTEFAEKVPKDSVILTLACGKYRFNKLGFFGDIGGIPRLLDVGQCNVAYSAIQIAVALAGAFECGVNDLPLSGSLS